MNTKQTRWLCLYLVMLSSLHAHAQMRQKAPTFQLPSAQEWRFHKFGNTPVDHYTGTASVSIPIYTYKDHEFEIPIALNYASNGYMPNIPTDVLGLGWYLDGIGDITRSINGVEDETVEKLPPYTFKNGLTYVNAVGSLHLLEHFQTLNGRDLEAVLLRDPNYYLPYMGSFAPDINEFRSDNYYFKFPGHRGAFQVAPMIGHKIKVYNTNHPWGEYRISGTVGDTDHPTPLYTLDITTGDGYIYTFGSHLDKQVNEHSEIYQFHLFTPPMPDYQIFPKGRISWPLTSIFSPSDRQVKFEYEGNTAPEGQPRNDYFTAYVPDPEYNRIFSQEKNDAGYRYVDFLSVFKDKGKVIDRYQSRIKRINIDNKIVISFVYGTKPLELCQSQNAPQLHNRGLIDEIRIDRTNADGSSKRLRTCKLYYTHGKGNPIAMLRKVEISGAGSYEMEYYNTNYNFPIINYNISDPWGFYNNGRDTQASGTDAMLGMLKNIKYPTGGQTEFEYEGHKFEHILAKSIEDRTQTFLTPTSLASTGGLRIKSITDYSAENKISAQRRFDYTLNGHSTGNALSYPRYILGPTPDTAGLSICGPVFNTARSSFLLDRTHIEYGAVTETQLDGSKKVYYFSNYQNMPDVNYVSRAVENNSIIKVGGDDRNPTSMQTQRGKLLRMESYDANDNLVYSESNHYDTSKELLANPSLESNQYFCYIGKTIVDDYPLLSTCKVYYQGADSLESV